MNSVHVFERALHLGRMSCVTTLAHRREYIYIYLPPCDFSIKTTVCQLLSATNY